jgi:hypothetical protein
VGYNHHVRLAEHAELRRKLVVLADVDLHRGAGKGCAQHGLQLVNIADVAVSRGSIHNGHLHALFQPHSPRWRKKRPAGCNSSI